MYPLFPKSYPMTQFYHCRIFLPFFRVEFFYFDKHIFRTLCLTRLRYSLFPKSHPMTQFYRCRIFCLFFLVEFFPVCSIELDPFSWTTFKMLFGGTFSQMDLSWNWLQPRFSNSFLFRTFYWKFLHLHKLKLFSKRRTFWELFSSCTPFNALKFLNWKPFSNLFVWFFRQIFSNLLISLIFLFSLRHDTNFSWTRKLYKRYFHE